VRYRLRIRAKAKSEILKAARHYERESETLGFQFLDCIEKAVDLILEFPEIFPVVFDSFRRALVKRFPYSIYYRVEVNLIVIEAVLHQHQDHSPLQGL